MAKKFPLNPANPERICWGCDQFCAITAMACSNERSPHPSELFGDDWLAWGDQQLAPDSAATTAGTPADPDTEEQT
ncbi:MAG: DUF3079 domain-containing protein [Comamonadaceae bacterium CG_4_10_14_3_um_filter_60_42]|nr:MAG: DUF3079 domain-containing protein [Comamonadaceae bacterium CG_4_10_14_3_um_filter_60_42]